MSATNRFINRLLLLIVGIVLFVGGVAALLSLTKPAWAQPVVDVITSVVNSSVQTVQGWTTSLGDANGVPTIAVLGGIALLIILVLLIVFVSTRGGGHSANVFALHSDRGTTDVRANIAEEVLAGALRDRPDVLSASTHVYRVGDAPAIRLAITPRRGASMRRLFGAVDNAVADWDALLGSDVPVIVHLRDRGVIASRRNPARVR